MYLYRVKRLDKPIETHRTEPIKNVTYVLKSEAVENSSEGDQHLGVHGLGWLATNTSSSSSIAGLLYFEGNRPCKAGK